MSCTQNQAAVGRISGLAAGINALGSKAGYTAGQVVGRLTGAIDQANQALGPRLAPLTNPVLQAVDRPATIAANAAPYVAGAALLAAATLRGRVYVVNQPGGLPAVGAAVALRSPAEAIAGIKTLQQKSGTVTKMLAAASALAATAAAMSRQSQGERVLAQGKRGLLSGQQEVRFNPSRLSGLLNGQDRILLDKASVVSSDGDIVAAGSKVWHRGTTVAKVNGQARTITHLRQMAVPSTSYYFDRRLSDAETADLVTGQAQPHKMAGYVGAVGAMEHLSPLWAETKRALILTRLHWPAPAPTAAERWVKQEQPEAAAPSVKMRETVAEKSRAGERM